jgi:hypothetical protein
MSFNKISCSIFRQCRINQDIKAYVGHHIGDGGLNCDTATHIGYTIDGDFGITSDDMMTDDMTWRLDSDLFFYNKP